MQSTSKILQIEGITQNALLNAVEEILHKEFDNLQKQQPAPVEFLTRQQVADMFGITLPTVHAWINAGILTAYKIGNKTRFKKLEVLAACKPLKSEKEGGSHE